MVNGGKINVTKFIINTSPYVEARRRRKNKINRSKIFVKQSRKKNMALKREKKNTIST
jgi:hypothetical protein